MSQLENSHLKPVNGNGCIRILLVDDEPFSLEVAKSALELMGNFEVDIALSVNEAFRKLAVQ